MLCIESMSQPIGNSVLKVTQFIYCNCKDKYYFSKHKMNHKENEAEKKDSLTDSLHIAQEDGHFQRPR